MNKGNPLNRLGEARKAIGLSQGDLGKTIRRSQSIISRIEKGEVTPDVHQARVLAQKLGVSVEELFGDTPAHSTQDETEDTPHV